MGSEELVLCAHPAPSQHVGVHGCCRQDEHEGPHYVWMVARSEDEWGVTVWEDTGEALVPRAQMEMASPPSAEEMCVAMMILDKEF